MRNDNLLDAHFGPALALWMGTVCDVTCRTLKEMDLDELDDDQLFEAARRFPNIVIFTKDYDFVELLHRLGAPPQVIWLRCPNGRNMRLQQMLATTLPDAMERIRAGEPLVEITIAPIAGD